MINVVCSVKNQAKKNTEVIVRSTENRKEADHLIDVVEIEVNGEKCLVDVLDIQDAIEKCSRRCGRRSPAYRNYIPVRGNPNWEENEEE